MDAALLTPSKYIKAIEFKGQKVTLTIAGIKIEELEREDNTKEKKGIISFVERPKSWVLNVTNVRCMVAMWGRETDNWIGKKIVLYPEANEASESGFAIRVWGSPDLDKDITFILKLARKKPRRVVLHATGKRPGSAAASASGKPAPAEAAVDETEPTDEELAVGDDFEEGFDGTVQGRIVP